VHVSVPSHTRTVPMVATSSKAQCLYDRPWSCELRTTVISSSAPTPLSCAHTQETLQSTWHNLSASASVPQEHNCSSNRKDPRHGPHNQCETSSHSEHSICLQDRVPDAAMTTDAIHEHEHLRDRRLKPRTQGARRIRHHPAGSIGT
jgi:hypothetical protein